MGYSYIVVRRGPRPLNPGTTVGRVGLVGQAALASAAELEVPVKELFLDSEHDLAQLEVASDALPLSEAPTGTGEPKIVGGLDAALRLEAYHWPRLVFPPLKKSGHIILDACTPEGEYMLLSESGQKT